MVEFLESHPSHRTKSDRAAHEAGVRVNTCFTVQACAFAVILSVSTFCTLPKDRLPWPITEDFKVTPPIKALCQKKDDENTSQETMPENEKFDTGVDTVMSDRNDNKIQSSNRVANTKADQTAAFLHPSSAVLSSRSFRVSRSHEEDISSSEYMLAINHVPRLSTTSVNRSVLQSVGRTPRMSPRSLLRKNQKYQLNHHHLSLQRIPQIQPPVSQHRCSISLDNVAGVDHLGVSPLAINHVPHLSSSVRSSCRSSLAGSVFNSMQSLEGQSDREVIEEVAGMGDDSVYEGKQKTLCKELLSPLFLMEVMWMSFQRLRSWFFIGVFNPWITTMAAGDVEKVSHYTSAFAAMQFFGIFTAPLSGRLMDRRPGSKYNYNNHKFERLHAAIPSFILNCSVVVLLSACAAIPILEVQYITFALHTLNRSFIYGPNSAFVANAFPFEYFGILLGTTLTVSAIFGMTQYPLFLLLQGPLNNDPKIESFTYEEMCQFYGWRKAGKNPENHHDQASNWQLQHIYQRGVLSKINIVLIALMMVTYAHPVYIWIYLQRKLKKQATDEKSSEPLTSQTTDKRAPDCMDQGDTTLEQPPQGCGEDTQL